MVFIIHGTTHSILLIGDIRDVIMTHIGVIIITTIVILIIILIMAVVRIIQNQIGAIIIGVMKMSVAILIVRREWQQMWLRLIGWLRRLQDLRQCVALRIMLYLLRQHEVCQLRVMLQHQLILSVVRLRRQRCLLVQQHRERQVVQFRHLRVLCRHQA